jgi:quinoprotein glucose dehydrogenase
MKIRDSHSLLLIGLILFSVSACNTDIKSYKDWQIYGGSNENIKYSSLTQIDTQNVKQLSIAWTYASGQASGTNTTDMKTNAIVVNGVLYGLNPQLKLFALEAATGKEKWVYDPGIVPQKGKNIGRGDFTSSTKINRGVTYYKGSDSDQRILYTAGGGHVYTALMH